MQAIKGISPSAKCDCFFPHENLPQWKLLGRHGNHVSTKIFKDFGLVPLEMGLGKPLCEDYHLDLTPL